MTSAGFEPETFRFLENLAANNSKEWFEANKVDYQRAIKKPADQFRPALQGALEELTGRALASKQFRINRDLRFSKDKTPYNTHIRMAFWPTGTAFEGKDAQPPSFFLSIEADHIRLGTGCMAFSKPVLGKYLSALETGGGDEVAALLTQLQKKEFELSEPDLAKAPRGFPKDHPHAELARHKGLGVWKTLPDPKAVLGNGAVAALVESWAPTLPFWRYLLGLQERT
ncbi:DUF2461 domain-containing protein [Roseibium sediminicola]|uniref:DUF2461 domain-containing protein n=1 Tax=Roseibium sediminicola TaxID=2933272 RepID=A0ABT0GWT0_9HYPH|nr:DUF2461 domain-containing protein [Roseibium sp. CAU 1639]MCK7613512.1 DUF2461 domain-containing protein [Roseibium sp. CAU 1639]